MYERHRTTQMPFLLDLYCYRRLRRKCHVFLRSSCWPYSVLSGHPTQTVVPHAPQEAEKEGAPVIVVDGEIEFKVDGWLPGHAEGSLVRKGEGWVEVDCCAMYTRYWAACSSQSAGSDRMNRASLLVLLLLLSARLFVTGGCIVCRRSTANPPPKGGPNTRPKRRVCVCV